MERKCGIKGCVEYALPGAYVEVMAVTLAGFDHVRIEVCASHFVVLTPRPEGEATCSTAS